MQNYNKADQQLHLLAQFIAKTNRAFVPTKQDDSHTNMAFDSLSNRVVGRWIDSPKGSIMLSLNLLTLDFEWLDASYNVLQTTPSVCKTILEIQEELSKELQKLGLNSEAFLEKLHYEIPEYPFAKEVIQSIGLEGLNDWLYFRKLANDTCDIALKLVNKEDDIRIWPHHFDTGIYAIADNKVGIGFGLAMRDSMTNAPYFYISEYTSGKTIDYSDVPDLQFGRWEIGENWKGAVLLLSDIDKENEANAKSSIFKFLEETVGWYQKQ